VFGARTTSAWPVVPNFLTVTELDFQFQLIGLASGQRGIGCNLSCFFSITSAVGLYFMIQKDPASPDWMLSGGLAPGHPLTLTDLAATLLAGFVTIPPAAPALVLDTADLTVVPGTSVTFRAGSVTPWPILAGLVLNSFTLTFAYTSGAKSPFTGALTTT